MCQVDKIFHFYILIYVFYQQSLKEVKYNLFPEVFGLGGHVKVDNIKPSETLLFSINTSMALGFVKRIQSGVLEVNLKNPIVPFKGDSAGVARNMGGHWRLIGHGEIV